MRVVYADYVFAVNAVINYLVLLASDRLCALNTCRARIVIGAVFGGIYSVLALFIPFFSEIAVKLTAGVFMTMAAFGGQRRLLRVILTVFGLSAAFAGVILGLSLMTGGDGTGIPFRTAVFAIGICCFAVSVAYRRLGRVSADTVRIRADYRGRVVEFSALGDTGHSLTDPLTGSPIIITDCDTAAKLLDRRAAPMLCEPPDRAVKSLGGLCYSFRLIPYRAIGIDSGLLIAFRPDRVTREGKPIRGCLIAVSPNPVSDGGAYSALIGVGNY